MFFEAIAHFPLAVCDGQTAQLKRPLLLATFPAEEFTLFQAEKDHAWFG